MKFGVDLICRFLPFCTKSAKFSTLQNLSEKGKIDKDGRPTFVEFKMFLLMSGAIKSKLYKI